MLRQTWKSRDPDDRFHGGWTRPSGSTGKNAIDRRSPAWLDEQAGAAWEDLLPMLEGMGILTRIDGHALARYCRLWSRWRKMERFIDEKGEMYPLRGEDGKVKCFQQ